ncbi:SAM dependent carboxyl methyltransferase [Trema orientale]|uniref:SAM dependent carboxyl methyltransferase n=1 Tax=Trema orientale TaxID=63057 RepID=A0A2P5EMT3_TREOI|nr:SAM dependent carboxyl methyltransferase [Trema orientale]
MSGCTDATAESHPMNGGDGTYSYTHNSNFQKSATNVASSMINRAVIDKLELSKLFSFTSSNNTFRIADLGCSIGPNTFIAMQNILEAVQQKYLHSQHQNSSSQMLEFQVFFNDHETNDFNTLFSSLPAKRQYFIAAVPGSFHGRLFPNSSLHFVHSSLALHWLSTIPKELLDRTSPAWNRRRIHYTSAPDEVYKAYQYQFAKDMIKFLDARARELVVGGLMVLIMPAVPNSVPLSHMPLGVVYDLLGCALMDMTREGWISEAQVDSFNLPVYVVSPKEMRELVDGNGCFSIQMMELIKPMSSVHDGQITARAITMHLRAAMEGIITKHFGGDIIDELFNRFYMKIEELSDQLQPRSKEGTQLFLVLERK